MIYDPWSRSWEPNSIAKVYMYMCTYIDVYIILSTINYWHLLNITLYYIYISQVFAVLSMISLSGLPRQHCPASAGSRAAPTFLVPRMGWTGRRKPRMVNNRGCLPVFPDIQNWFGRNSVNWSEKENRNWMKLDIGNYWFWPSNPRLSPAIVPCLGNHWIMTRLFFWWPHIWILFSNQFCQGDSKSETLIT